jgi:hypothetical protein
LGGREAMRNDLVGSSPREHPRGVFIPLRIAIPFGVYLSNKVRQIHWKARSRGTFFLRRDEKSLWWKFRPLASAASVTD